MFKRKHDDGSIESDKKFKSDFGQGHTLDSDEEDQDIEEEK